MQSAHPDQPGMAWLTYALMTVAAWGVYGILLHSGQSYMKDAAAGRYKAFLFVGLAYFLTAVLAPLVLLWLKGATWSFTASGCWWSLLAGTAGAIGAFFVLVAFGSGGSPAVVMTIVFAGAPVVNSVVALLLYPPQGGWGTIRWPFFAGILLAALGGALVTLYKPPPAAAPAKTAARPLAAVEAAPFMSCPDFTSREAIRAHQLPALRRLLEAVAASNPFYGPILREARLGGDLADLDAFFARMPFTPKESIVEDHRRHPPYGSNLTYPLSAYCRYNQTSATRGAPLRWLDTAESWQWMLDNWKQVYRAAGVAPQDCLYFAFSFGPFLGFWTAFEAACQLGCRSIPGGGLSSLARLHAIRDNRADVLLCTPTYALRLAEVAAAEGIDLAQTAVRTIVVAGEPGGSVPAVRQTIESLWPRATVFDQHGMTEVGPVSYQCPERPCTLLVMESSYLAEVIDPHGERPVAPGEIGELVLTTLGRLGSPLIRYRTGDLVRESTEIAARLGHHEMALRGGILGRTDDMLLVRGMNVYPPALDDVLRSFPEVAEYQVEIDTRGAMTELAVRIEPMAGRCDDGAALAARVESRIRAAFNLRMPVTLCAAGSLPRPEMKSGRWVRT